MARKVAKPLGKHMRMVLILWSAFACMALAGCATRPPEPSIGPQIVAAPGTFIHAGSGMGFPVAIDEHRRIEVVRYDAAGLDVSAGYNLVGPLGMVVATVYVFPSPVVVLYASPATTRVKTDAVVLLQANRCAQAFDVQKDAVRVAHPAARPIGETEVHSQRYPNAAHARMATFEFEDNFAGQRQALRSELWVFCGVNARWSVKFRFTYPSRLNATAQIAAFMARLPESSAAAAR